LTAVSFTLPLDYPEAYRIQVSGLGGTRRWIREKYFLAENSESVDLKNLTEFKSALKASSL
jgi:hypothetical protein